jgi:endonuclease/exonuclease/phosphatase family metal-dependent hydrolase
MFAVSIKLLEPFVRTLWIVACSLAATWAGAVPAAATAATVRILSYNIHHAEGRDSTTDLNRIASVINSAKPDLVAIQELDQGNSRSGMEVFQLDLLAQLTGMQGHFGKTFDYAGGEYGNGVLVSPNLTVGQVVRHQLPTPAAGEARSVLEVKISTDEDEAAEVTFFATHFSHENDENRFAQAGFVNDLVGDSPAPAILAGDLNSRPDSRPMTRLFEKWQDPTHLPDPGRSRAAQIDYVLYRTAESWRVVEPGRFIVDAVTDVASDHYPLLTVLELAPPNADFDEDGRVGALDVETWKGGFGIMGVATNEEGDANRDRNVDGADFLVWQRQLGAAHLAIPEPRSHAGWAVAVLLAAAQSLHPRYASGGSPRRLSRPAPMATGQ